MRRYAVERGANGMPVRLSGPLAPEPWDDTAYRAFLTRLSETPRSWWKLVTPHEAGCGGWNLIRYRYDTCPLFVFYDWERLPLSATEKWWSDVRAASDGHHHPSSSWHPKNNPARIATLTRMRAELLQACGLEEGS